MAAYAPDSPPTERSIPLDGDGYPILTYWPTPPPPVVAGNSYNPYEHKTRRKTTPYQLGVLESVFRENPKPTSKMRERLAEQLGMLPRSVQVWFQNRRAKEKGLLKATLEKVVTERYDGGNSAENAKSEASTSVPEKTTSNTEDKSAAVPEHAGQVDYVPHVTSINGTVSFFPEDALSASYTFPAVAPLSLPRQDDHIYATSRATACSTSSELTTQHRRNPYSRERATSLPEACIVDEKPSARLLMSRAHSSGSSYVMLPTGPATIHKLPPDGTTQNASRKTAVTGHSRDRGIRPALRKRALTITIPTTSWGQGQVTTSCTPTGTPSSAFASTPMTPGASFIPPGVCFAPSETPMSWGSARRGSCPSEFIASFDKMCVASQPQSPLRAVHPQQQAHSHMMMDALRDPIREDSFANNQAADLLNVSQNFQMDAPGHSHDCDCVGHTYDGVSTEMQWNMPLNSPLSSTSHSYHRPVRPVRRCSEPVNMLRRPFLRRQSIQHESPGTDSPSLAPFHNAFPVCGIGRPADFPITIDGGITEGMLSSFQEVCESLPDPTLVPEFSNATEEHIMACIERILSVDDE